MLLILGNIPILYDFILALFMFSFWKISMKKYIDALALFYGNCDKLKKNERGIKEERKLLFE